MKHRIYTYLTRAAGTLLLLSLLLAGCGSGGGTQATATETSDKSGTKEETAMKDPETQTTSDTMTDAPIETPTESVADVTSSRLLYALSDTGLEVMAPQDAASEKQVGIFYFIWQGTENAQPQIYDNTEILSRMDLTGKTSISLSEWQAAGGGPKGDFHWWGQPLFGYYDMNDKWVISRHLQMFAQAGIDFIVLDQTNGVREGYIQRITSVYEVAYDLQQQGVRVPKIALMSYDDGSATVDKLYYYFFFKHPEWSSLHYHWNDHEKPVIFDNIAGYTKTATAQINTEKKLASYDPAVTAAVELRDVSFPHETNHADYNGTGLLYLDFRKLPQVIRDKSDGGYTFMSISVAEICGTNCSTANILTETADRSRNFDGTCNVEWHGQPEAWRYGYNFARQLDHALKRDPDMIFITGWNEWIAQLQVRADGSISLIDNADINNSRDIEPMSGGYGDNYYLQMCRYISQFKYGTVALAPAGEATVDLTADSEAWLAVGAVSYDDPTGDGVARDHQAAAVSSIRYTTPAADNDITCLYVAADADATYLRVETAEAVKDAEKAGNLVLLIKTGDKTYAINHAGGTATTCPVEELVDGNWKAVGEATCRTEGDRFSVAVSAELIPNRDTLYIKWADGIDDPADRMAFYTCPESAPYGGMFLAFRK